MPGDSTLSLESLFRVVQCTWRVVEGLQESAKIKKVTVCGALAKAIFCEKRYHLAIADLEIIAVLSSSALTHLGLPTAGGGSFPPAEPLKIFSVFGGP